MLRVPAACDVVFGHRQFSYPAGALHSANDKPAAVFAVCSAPAADGLAFALPHLLEVIVLDTESPAGIAKYGAFDHTSSRGLIHERRPLSAHRGHSCWYSAGELHRDYGPAVVGATARTVWGVPVTTPWWYKYYYGKQMASGANTYMGELTELSPRLRAFGSCVCSSNRGCVKLIACVATEHVWLSDSCTPKYIHVYQSCAGTILEFTLVGSLFESPGAGVNRSCCVYFRVGEVVESNGCRALYRFERAGCL